MSQLNSVWVFSDNPERYAELFGGAQQWGQQVYAIVQNTDQAQAVMPYGPKCIYVLEQNDALQRTENYAESIAALLKDKHPAMLLLAATKRGKALAARLSVQLNAALVNDAAAVDIVDGHICAEYSAAIFLIPICISFDTAEKRRYATYLILNRRFSFEF